MRVLGAFLRFWYDFIVGDDWTVAAGVVVAVAATGVLTRSHVNAWWLLPVAAAILLAVSLLRVAGTARPRPAPESPQR
jgi:hypothetical protein